MLAYGSRHQDFLSDPRFTLVTAQAIVDHGQVYLDSFGDEGIFGFTLAEYLTWEERLVYVNGRHFDFFPLGPAVLSVPAVWVARLAGLDMSGPDNFVVQRLLSAVSVVGVYLLLYCLARSRLEIWPSFVLAAIFAAGTSVLSTMGSALWSMNYTTPIAAAALCLIAHKKRYLNRTPGAMALGGLLFLAFFTRPTAASLVAILLAYLALGERKTLVVTSLTAGTLLGLFVLWSRQTYGMWLPPYYMPLRLATGAAAPIGVAILGHLVSPSRGLLVFSPFLVIPALGIAFYPKRVLADKIVLVCLFWSVSHIYISSQAVKWYGGWSFGPRLLTEIVPGLLLLTACMWSRARPLLPSALRRVVVVSFVTLGGVSAMIHGLQGLYNPSITEWNALVSPVPVAPFEGLGDMFRWRYSQALLSDATICRIEQDQLRDVLPYDTTLRAYEWDTPIGYSADLEADWRGLARRAAAGATEQAGIATNSALFIGFLRLPQPHLSMFPSRWTRCPVAHVVLGPVPVVAPDSFVVLSLTLSSGQGQIVRVHVNGTYLGDNAISGQAGAYQAESFWYLVPAGLFRKGQRNVVTIDLPASADRSVFEQFTPSWQPLGVALHELRMFPLDTSQISHNLDLPRPMFTISGEGGRTTVVPATLEYGLSLVAVSPPLVQEEPEPAVHLALAWQSDGAATAPYKSYVHLIGPDGTLLAQDDSQSGYWGLPTTEWRAGEPVWIRYALTVPSDLAPGEYRLYAGMYHPETFHRLQVVSSDLPTSEHGILVGAFTVRH